MSNKLFWQLNEQCSILTRREAVRDPELQDETLADQPIETFARPSIGNI